jgi:hypothetical protein
MFKDLLLEESKVVQFTELGVKSLLTIVISFLG